MSLFSLCALLTSGLWRIGCQLPRFTYAAQPRKLAPCKRICRARTETAAGSKRCTNKSTRKHERRKLATIGTIRHLNSRKPAASSGPPTAEIGALATHVQLQWLCIGTNKRRGVEGCSSQLRFELTCRSGRKGLARPSAAEGCSALCSTKPLFEKAPTQAHWAATSTRGSMPSRSLIDSFGPRSRHPHILCSRDAACTSLPTTSRACFLPRSEVKGRSHARPIGRRGRMMRWALTTGVCLCVSSSFLHFTVSCPRAYKSFVVCCRRPRHVLLWHACCCAKLSSPARGAARVELATIFGLRT